jgi:hypothetical protein
MMTFESTFQSRRVQALTIKERVSRTTVSGRFATHDDAQYRSSELPISEIRPMLSPHSFL